MTLHISPYLQPYLTLATKLPDQFPDVPEAVVQALQARIRKLVELVAVRDEEIRQLEQRGDRLEQLEARLKMEVEAHFRAATALHYAEDELHQLRLLVYEPPAGGAPIDGPPHTCHAMNPPFPYECAACIEERIDAALERGGEHFPSTPKPQP